MTTTINAGAVGAVSIAGGSAYTLEETGTITNASGYAMTLASGDCQISVFGGIYGQSGIIESNTGISANSVYIGTSGIVSGVSGYGVELFDDQNFVTNDGLVQGYYYGVELVGDQENLANNGRIAGSYLGIAFAGANGSLTNTGTITGGEGVEFGNGTTAATDYLANSGTIAANVTNPEATYSYGVADENHLGNMVADNSGYISGNYGVAFEGASGLTDILTNTGTIDGNLYNAVEEVGGAALQISNSGTLSGGASTAIFFDSDDTANTLDNSGTIHGNVTSASDSTLTVTNSGHIAGGIVFGEGDDSYDGTLGSITNYVHGGGGDDSLTGGAGQDRLDGGSGDDTIYGNGGNDILTAAGTLAAIHGGDGNDMILMTSYLNAADTIDGGSGYDTLVLNGDYSLGLTLGQETLSAVEQIKLTDGFSYKLVTDDGNVAAGQELKIDGSGLTGTNTIKFYGAAETDGWYYELGGAGADVLEGGQGNDVLVDNVGRNWFIGEAGADRITGTGGNDRFVYYDVTDSTSTAHDVITGFLASSDHFDLDVTVTGVDLPVTGGVLRSTTFDANLASAIGATQMAAGHAVVFTATSGNLAGHTYLIVDANGVAGYQAGQDYVMELTGGNPGLTTANFI
ncbi:MAG TPA: bluetail domain-containing putative surface protein [Rhizomicrobium sp.]|jgi:Ca2+-binding RTX toxin-like protein